MTLAGSTRDNSARSRAGTPEVCVVGWPASRPHQFVGRTPTTHTSRSRVERRVMRIEWHAYAARENEIKVVYGDNELDAYRGK